MRRRFYNLSVTKRLAANNDLDNEIDKELIKTKTFGNPLSLNLYSKLKCNITPSILGIAIQRYVDYCLTGITIDTYITKEEKELFNEVKNLEDDILLIKLCIQIANTEHEKRSGCITNDNIIDEITIGDIRFIQLHAFNFINFMNEVKFQIINLGGSNKIFDRKIGNTTYYCNGDVDYVVKKDNTNLILDLKCTKYEKVGYTILQQIGYKILFEYGHANTRITNSVFLSEIYATIMDIKYVTFYNSYYDKFYYLDLEVLPNDYIHHFLRNILHVKNSLNNLRERTSDEISLDKRSVPGGSLTIWNYDEFNQKDIIL